LRRVDFLAIREIHQALGWRFWRYIITPRLKRNRTILLRLAQ